jgi:tRNA pseudouridine32 synthase/23S rRNA pseudouridine746 synthase
LFPDLVYLDDDLLVLNKPSGLLAVPGRGPDKQDCLSARVQAHHPEALVVHRLDQPTSGLMLMARHAEAQRRLSDAFAQREVEKRYAAVVSGQPVHQLKSGDANDGWGLIDLPIAVDWPRRPLRVIDAAGKPSQTRWRLEGPGIAGLQTQSSRLLLEPLTGRTHQLRVHLAAIGHPILGDALYADEAVRGLSDRLLLHACWLRFAHPMTGLALELSSPASF